MLQGSPRPLRCSRTLARPRSCSGTLARPRSCSGTRQTTPCSGTSRQTTPCSGTSRQTTSSSDHVDHISSSSAELRPRQGDFVGRSSTCARGLPRPRLGDFVARSSTCARGFHRSLLDLCSGTASTTLRPRLGDFASRLHATGNSHTVGDILSHLDLATRLIPRLPASSGTTSVRCTCRCILYRLYDGWILNLTGNSF